MAPSRLTHLVSYTDPMFDPHALPVPDLGLACQQCGYPLAGLTEHRCPECGRTFNLDDHIPPGDFPPLIAGGKEVRHTADVAALLRRYQIPFIETHDPIRDTLGPYGVGRWHQPAPIAVPRELYFEAVDLIRRHALNEPMPEPPPQSAVGQPAADWTCPDCHEPVPGNFAICWNCNRHRTP